MEERVRARSKKRLNNMRIGLILGKIDAVMGEEKNVIPLYRHASTTISVRRRFFRNYININEWQVTVQGHK